MRAIDQNDPESLNNQGVVVFHVGSNIAGLWEDFQEFNQADQEFFEQLLPLENFDFTNGDEIELDLLTRTKSNVEIKEQGGIYVSEIPLILEDEEVRNALDLLKEKGVEIGILK